MIDPENPEKDDMEDGIEVSGPEEESPEEEAGDEFEAGYEAENPGLASDDGETHKKGLGLFPVLGLSLLAAIIGAVGGAVGGAYGTQYLTPPPDVGVLRAEFQKEIAQAKTEVRTQTKSDTQNALNAIRRDLSGLKTQISRSNAGEDLQPALTAIEKRVQSLEDAPDPNMTDIDPKTINALKAAQKDGFKWPETEAMETDVTELQSETAQLKSQIEEVSAQIASFETKIVEIASNTSQTPPETEPAKFDGPVFPKQALLNAAKAKVDSQGLFARTLHKHIHVDSPDSPKNQIEDIETAYEKGDVYTAIKTFDRLPSDIRSAGQDWRDAADRLQ